MPQNVARYKKTLIGPKCHHCKRDVAVHPRPPPTVHEEPDSLSEVVEGRELKLNEKVEIYEHRLDRRESGKIWYFIHCPLASTLIFIQSKLVETWTINGDFFCFNRYLINKNGKEWVSQECVAIDYEFVQPDLSLRIAC